MPVWLRFLANPKLFGRFMKSKAGRRAAFKWGAMIVKSRTAQSLIDKFINKNGKTLDKNKEYKKLEKEYKKAQQRIADLERMVEQNNENQTALQTNTFALGRQVIELQRLYAQMQNEIHRIQQQQIVMSAVQNTR